MKEAVDYYLDSHKDPDFQEDEEMYDHLDMVDEEPLAYLDELAAVAAAEEEAAAQAASAAAKKRASKEAAEKEEAAKSKAAAAKLATTPAVKGRARVCK